MGCKSKIGNTALPPSVVVSDEQGDANDDDHEFNGNNNHVLHNNRGFNGLKIR